MVASASQVGRIAAASEPYCENHAGYRALSDAGRSSLVRPLLRSDRYCVCTCSEAAVAAGRGRTAVVAAAHAAMTVLLPYLRVASWRRMPADRLQTSVVYHPFDIRQSKKRLRVSSTSPC